MNTVHVKVTVDDEISELTVVGDRHDVWFALDVGNAVKLAILGVRDE